MSPMETPTNLTERYQLTTHLARGGMADVYQGTDSLLDRRVAIKILHSQFSLDEAFVKRFRKEAQAAANLTHPNIVGIYDWGQLDSTYFIVMELVDGRSLREVLKSSGPLLPRRAVEISSEVAAALSVAHRSGLVHRDVKPGNILLAPDGTVKVTDFGIARAWNDSQELTKTGAVMGTATYFSPEQAQGLPADERSDIYSLGIVLFEMLTGRTPFRGDSPVAVAYQHVSQAAVAPSTINPDVSPELDALVLKALSKRPEDRYQTAEALRADLWRLLQGEKPLVATGAPTTAGVRDDGATRMIPTPSPPPATVPPDEIYRQLEPPPSSNLAFVFGTFALLAVLAVLVYLVFNTLNEGTTATPVDQIVTVPNVAGQTETEGLLILQRANLIATPRGEASDDVEPGIVIRTEPAAGSQVPADTEVTLFFSAGSDRFPVPRVELLEQSAAEDLIKAQGFTVGTVDRETNDEIPVGNVISQDPAPGTNLPEGSPVNLVVSSGPEFVTWEALEGLTEPEALAVLEGLGLEVDPVREFNEEIEEGLVVTTDPEPGTETSPGSTVQLIVSDGPAPIPVPDLRGLDVPTARARANDLGFDIRVSNDRFPVSDPGQVDIIQTQGFNPDDLIEPGDIMIVRVGALIQTTTTTAPPGDGGG